MAEPLGMADNLRVRLKSVDVSDPTNAKVIFALNAVSQDGDERWLADLPVDEATGTGRDPNLNLIGTSAKIALALRLRGTLENLKAELPRDTSYLTNLPG